MILHQISWCKTWLCLQFLLAACSPLCLSFSVSSSSFHSSPTDSLAFLFTYLALCLVHSHSASSSKETRSK